MTAPPPFSLPITYGAVGNSPIAGYTNAAAWDLIFVTLSADYARDPPAGYPIRLSRARDRVAHGLCSNNSQRNPAPASSLTKPPPW